MRACLMLEGQEGVTWAQWLETAHVAERLGFEGLFTSDHYTWEMPQPGSSDAWTLLSALAARTERLRLGTLVSPVTFRLPGVLAKVATTVDHVSGGRIELGMGAGWHADEHRRHGIPFPPTSERFAMLEEQLEIVHGLWSKDRFSFNGTHYTVDDALFMPKPVQRPHPPIIVGGSGMARTARAVARWADEYNRVGGTPEDVRASFERVRAAIVDAGRDPSSVTMSFMTWIVVGRTEDEFRSRVEEVRSRDPRAGSFDEYLADVSKDCFVGTVDQVVARMNEYVDVGVERFFLNHELFDDLEHVELIAEAVLPHVRG